MRKFVKIAAAAASLIFVIAGVANAREDYRNVERQVTAREFRSVVDQTQRPSRRPPPSVPEHGPAYDVVGAP
jgi:hypothetical protein